MGSTMLLLSALFLFVNVHSSPVETTRTCLVDDIPVQRGHTLNEFLGVWYGVARTTTIWGNDTCISNIWNFVPGDDGTILTVFTAFREQDGTCILPTVTALEPTGTLGDFRFPIMHRRGFLKFVYMESGIALVYLCIEKSEAGTCPLNKLAVGYWTRTGSLRPEEREALESRLIYTCVDKAEIEFTETGKCIIPHLDKSFAKKTASYVAVPTTPAFVVNTVGGKTAVLPCSIPPADDNRPIWMFERDTGMQVLTVLDRPAVEDNHLAVSRPSLHDWNLEISRVTRDYQRVYVCYNKKQAVRKVLLVVLVPPRISAYSDNKDVKVGQDMTLECLTEGFPQPTVRWYYRTLRQHPNTRQRLATGSKVTITDFSRSRTGIYECVAENGVPPAASQSTTVRAAFAPEISVSAQQVYKHSSEDLFLDCRVSTYPFGVVGWSFKGATISNTDKYRVDIYADSADSFAISLRLRHLKKEDFGMYRCYASNAHGNAGAEVAVHEFIEEDRCVKARRTLQVDFQLSRFLGDYQRIKTTPYLYGNRTYLSESVKYFINADGHFSVAYRGYDQNVEECLPAGARVMEEDKPGKYTYREDGQQVFWQVVYTDYTIAVTYACHLVQSDGRCLKENVHAEIISKVYPIPPDTMKWLEGYFSGLCLDTDDLVTAIPELCVFTGEFLESVGYIGSGVSEDYLCQVERTRVQENFDLHRFLGEWQGIKTTIYRYGANTPTSETLRFYRTKKGKMAFAYAGFNEERESCMAPGYFELDESSPGKYTLNVGKSQGVLQIVYTDYKHAVTYSCSRLDKHGRCPRQYVNVEIISREYPVQTSTMEYLEQYVTALCVDLEDMIDQSQGLCDIKASYLASINYGGPGDPCHEVRTKVQRDFDLERFLGEWHNIKTTTYRYGSNTPTSETLRFFLNQEEKMVGVFKGYNGTSGQCGDAMSFVTEQVVPGAYSFAKEDRKGEFYMVYTDYNHTITYSCSEVQNDGHCPADKVSVAIISRTYPVDPDILTTLEQHVTDMCVDLSKDVISSIPGKCELPMPLLNSLGYFDPGQCQVDNMEIQADFDMDLFIGTWQVIKTTPNQYGEKLYLAAIQTYFLMEDGSFTTAYRGYIKESDQELCFKPGTITLDYDDHGDYFFTTSAGEGKYKVFYTDYTHAVTYSCRQVAPDGQCPKEFRHISIISREQTISSEKLVELEKYVTKACILPSELMNVKPGICEIPHIFLESIGYSGPDPCQVGNIHLQENFDIDQFLGDWHMIKTTTYVLGRHTFVSTVQKYFKTEDGKVKLAFRGYNTQGESCQDSGSIELEEKSSGDFTAANGRVFFKFVYTDYTHAVIYNCLQVGTDERCMKERMYVSIISRQTSVPPETMEVLERHVSNLCVNTSELMQGIVGICRIPGSYLQSEGFPGAVDEECHLSNIVPYEYDVSRMAGEWYTLWSTPSAFGEGKNVWGPAKFVVYDGNLVTLYRGRNHRSRQCKPTETITVRPGKLTDDNTDGHTDKVIFRILYTDYTTAVVYSCLSVGENGHCKENKSMIEVLSKSTEITEEKLRHLKRYISVACLDSNSLGKHEEGYCHVPENIVQAARSGLLPKDYSVIGCHSDFIPVQENFNVSEFTGDNNWFTVWRSPHMWPYETPPPQRSKMIQTVDGKLFLLSRNYRDTWASCEPTEAVKLEEVRPGEYTFVIGEYSHWTGVYKILYADDNNAVTYTCFHATEGKDCPPETLLVEVLSRNKEINKEALKVLEPHISEACVLVDVMVLTTPDVCEIPDSIISATRRGQIETDYAVPIAGCHENLILHQQDFEAEQFAGTWNVILQTVKVQNRPLRPSETAHVVFTEGRMTYMWKTYLDDIEMCSPTKAALLLERSGQGDYCSTLDTGFVIFKVLFSDYNNAVTFSCHGIDVDGKCQRNTMEIQILSRNTTISEEDLVNLKTYLAGTCATADELHMPSSPGMCHIPEEIIHAAEIEQIPQDYIFIGCQEKFIPVPPVDVSKLAGTYNTILSPLNFLGKSYLETKSKIVCLVNIGDGIYYLARLYNSTSKTCSTVSSNWLAPKRPGDFTANFSGFQGWSKILYSDETEIVMYTCLLTNPNGICSWRFSMFEIYSRNTVISQEKFKHLKNYASLVCAGLSHDAEQNPPAPCVIPKNVIAAASKGELPQADVESSCIVKLIPVQERFDVKRFAGKWNVFELTPYIWDVNFWKSLVMNFIITDDGKLILVYWGYRKSCTPTEMTVLTEASHPGHYTFLFGSYNATMKLIYTDYVNAVAYTCLEAKKDGTCGKNRIHVSLMSKYTHMSPETVKKLKPFVTDGCAKFQDLKHAVLGLCPVPQQILQAVQAGDIQSNYSIVGCHKDFISVHPAELATIAGLYNAIFRSDGTAHPYSTLLTLIPFGNGMYYIRQHYNATDQTCMDISSMWLKQEQPGAFTSYSRERPVWSKILYADDTEIVFLSCLDSVTDRICEPSVTVFEIYSRNTAISNAKLKYLKKFAANVCLKIKGDGQTNPPAPCVIPYNIQEAARKGEIPKYLVETSCMLKFIPVQENFDIESFVGVWHVIKRTKLIWGENTWASVIEQIVIQEDGGIQESFTGHQQDGSCVAPVTERLVEASGPGEYMFGSGEDRKILKILYTNYQRFALVYRCYEILPDGTCKRNKVHLELMSRFPNVDTSSLQIFDSLIKKACVDPDVLYPTSTELCETPEVTPSDKIPCTVADIHQIPEFEILQMAGLWYGIARTRLTFNKMESIVIFYTYNAEKNYLDGVYTGSLNGVCQMPIMSVTKSQYEDGKAPQILGRIEGPESVFTWVSFKIMYFDGRYLMYYACYGMRSDGTCEPDKMEVTLLGRMHGLDSSLEPKLDKLMKSVCLHSWHLVEIKTEADCMTNLFAKKNTLSDHMMENDKSCAALKTMKVEENFSEDEFLGRWVGVSYVDMTSPHLGSHSFTVTVSKYTDNIMKMQIDRRGGNSQLLHIVLKPRCRGSQHGDYMTTYGSGKMSQWSSLKIIHADANTALLYWCTRDSVEGSCLQSGIRAELLSRIFPLAEGTKINILQKLHEECINVDSYHHINTADHYKDFLDSVEEISAEPVIPTPYYSVDSLPTVNFDQQLQSGYWYEIAHGSGSVMSLQSTTIYYHPVGNGNIRMMFSGLGPDGKCVGPMHGDLRPRCPDIDDGNYEGRFRMPGSKLWTTFKIMYTDYEHACIAFGCTDENMDGTCSVNGTRIHILSRSSTLEDSLRTKLNNLIDLTDIDSSTLIETNHQGNCFSKVREGLKKIQDQTMDDAEPAGEDSKT